MPVAIQARGHCLTATTTAAAETTPLQDGDRGWFGRVFGGVWGYRGRRRRSAVALSAEFEGEKNEDAGNQDGQEEHGLAFYAPALVPGGDFELLVGLLDIRGHALNVVINAIQHAALVDDHGLQVLENVGELDDALCDVFDFTFALGDEGVVGVVHQALLMLLCLLERRLRKGAVGFRVGEGWVVVRVLSWGAGAEGRVEATKIAEFCGHD